MLRRSLDKLGFQNTKIIAADGEWDILHDILSDQDLAQSVDVIG